MHIDVCARCGLLNTFLSLACHTFDCEFSSHSDKERCGRVRGVTRVKERKSEEMQSVQAREHIDHAILAQRLSTLCRCTCSTTAQHDALKRLHYNTQNQRVYRKLIFLKQQ